MPGVNLSMTAFMGYSEQVGTIAQFFDNAKNDVMIQQLTEDDKATYDANMFAVTVFDKKWDVANQVRPNRTGDLIQYYQPIMIEGTVGSGAKRALIEPQNFEGVSTSLLRKPANRFPMIKPRF